jgi:hypothetical protein
MFHTSAATVRKVQRRDNDGSSFLNAFGRRRAGGSDLSRPGFVRVFDMLLASLSLDELLYLVPAM